MKQIIEGLKNEPLWWGVVLAVIGLFVVLYDGTKEYKEQDRMVTLKFEQRAKIINELYGTSYTVEEIRLNGQFIESLIEKGVIVPVEKTMNLNYLKKMRNWTIEMLMKPRWVVNSTGELGFRICGINFWYYKRSDPIIGTSDDNPFWRTIEKREFGEVIKRP